MSTTGIIIIIAIVAIILGVGIFFLVRYLTNKEKYDLTTKYGTKILLSPQTKNIKVDVFNNWSDDVVDFWYKSKDWNKKECYEELSKMKVKIYDAEYLERSGYKVSGMMCPESSLIEISTFPKGTQVASLERIASLFRHETSHIIAQFVGNLDPGIGGEAHHKLFAEVSLKA